MNAAEPRDIEKAALTQRSDKAVNSLIIKTLMSSDKGRRWIWLELSAANVFASTICWGPDGYAQTAFKEGQRSRGIAMLNAVTTLCPNEYITMTRENAPKGQSIQEPTDD